MKTALLFPGQGSQFLGMGKEFIERYPECAATMELAEKTCGMKLQSICSDGPMEELTRGAVLQPAITATNIICYQALQHEAGNDLQIDCLAGHSLGEYSALCASGVISAEDALRLVSKRGTLMEREGRANPGGMRAIVGLDINTIESIIDSYDGPGVVTAANHNTPVQVVISGSIEALDNITPLAEGKGAKVIPLNVSVANHSPLVAGAVPDFTDFLATIPFNSPGIPVYFNVSSTTEQEPAQIKEMMAKQIISKVRWCEIILTMIAQGVDTFIEVGPKPVLKGMMRKIAPKGTKVTSLQFDTPDSLDKCLEKIRS